MSIGRPERNILLSMEVLPRCKHQGRMQQADAAEGTDGEEKRAVLRAGINDD
jgi:hypothetical protein